jgi:hypothetical protein
MLSLWLIQHSTKNCMCAWWGGGGMGGNNARDTGKSLSELFSCSFEGFVWPGEFRKNTLK